MEIATSDNGRCRVLLSTVDGAGYVIVEYDGDPIEDMFITSKEEAEEVLENIYESYDIDYPDFKDTDDTDDADEEREDRLWTIKDREEELLDETVTFLWTIWGDKLPDKEAKGIMEDILEFLAEKYPQYHIVRPMFLVDEYGQEIYEEYPYRNYTW